MLGEIFIGRFGLGTFRNYFTSVGGARALYGRDYGKFGLYGVLFGLISGDVIYAQGGLGGRSTYGRGLTILFIGRRARNAGYKGLFTYYMMIYGVLNGFATSGLGLACMQVA